MTGAAILLYHRVAEPGTDPFKLAVSPENFRAHVEYLAQTRCVVPLTEVRTASRTRRIAITFDDGYADNASVAAPLLAGAGLPATWFITAGKLGGRRFWWDRLSHAVLGPHPIPDAVDLELPGAPVWLDLRTPTARARALTLIHRRIRPLPPADVEAVVDAVVAALGAPPPASDGVSMSLPDLRAMAQLPGCDIGAHTLNHVQLRGQTSAVKRREIAGSVSLLESLLGRPIRTFAYPYGDPRAVDRESRRLVHDAGCELACSTDPGLAQPGRRRFRLPRIVVGDWSVSELRSVLTSAAVNRLSCPAVRQYREEVPPDERQS